MPGRLRAHNRRRNKRGVIKSNDNTKNGAKENPKKGNSSSSASCSTKIETVLAKAKKRKIMTDVESFCYVKETTKALGEDHDATCMICADKIANCQFIHKGKSNGDGKQHNCTHRICYDCLKESIANQEAVSGEIIQPKCPFCKGVVAKAVKIETGDQMKTIHLPPFKERNTVSTLVAGNKAGLKFAFNYEDVDDEDHLVVTSWKLLAPGEHEPHHVVKSTMTGTFVFLMTNVIIGIPGLPSCSFLERSIMMKLREINKPFEKWLPEVYRSSTRV